MTHPAILPASHASAPATKRGLEQARSYRPLMPDSLYIDIVVPVLNEAGTLERQITKLDAYMGKHLPFSYRIIIADNGSTDGTAAIAERVSESHSTVSLNILSTPGRGRALKTVWARSRADIVAYMDVDLSTDLSGFLPMITPLITGEAGVAIGTRLAAESRTTRSRKREFISRSYNRLIKWTSGTSFSDAQCGFKALRRDVAEQLLPRIKDDEWFFDTELLIKAERKNIPIHEQAVTWVEDPDSRVKLAKTALQDIRGLARVRAELDQRTLVEKLALPVLLVVTFGVYLFGALQNDMANSYYSAAVQAASVDWKAWFFGSLDAGNFITIDKPPLATQIMGLSARIFGFSSFSMLLPNVLAGVGSVWLVYKAVSRQFGFKSAIIAAAALAATPVAALMFGFNNPDAILTFMLTASAYAFLRALENKRPLVWLALAGLFTGLAFNTKMLQGLMLVPAFGVVYLLLAAPPLPKRVAHLSFAGIVTAMATFSWSFVVSLIPASARPYIGSTSDNNIWSLIFGYNGFGRLFGSGMGGGPGGGGGGPGGTGFGGDTGVLRIFNSDFGPNIGWWLLAALIGGGFLLWLLRRSPRDNRGRAQVLLWLLWVVIHIVIFSMTEGVIHPYYVVAMAPAVAALVGIGLPFLISAYRRRGKYAWLLPTTVLATTVLAVVLLGYANAWPAVSWLVIILGILGSLGLVLQLLAANRTLARASLVVSTVACLVAPVAYTSATVTAVHTGSIPTAGPGATAMAGTNNEASQADSALVAYLLENQGDATWIVAVASANESAAIQITSGQPVMAIGGFNGGDSALTLEQFKRLVADGKVRYYLTGGGMSGRGGGPGGMGGSGDISSWVQSNGTVVEYGGNGGTLYKLSS